MAHSDDADDRAQPSGLATLDAGGLVPLAQLPGGLPSVPSGPAGGDLGDTYPNPTVRQASKAFALPGVISPPSFAATEDDYAPTSLATASMIRVTTSADLAALSGLTGGAPGRVVTLYNVGSFKLSLLNQDAASAAANRFALDASALVKPDTAVVLQYDSVSSRWRVAGAGSSIPTLLPAPKFAKVTEDISTTSSSYVTMFSGTFLLAPSETNLILILIGNVTSSNANRRIETRVLINGVSIGGSSGAVDSADLPFVVSYMGQVVGIAGSNTYEVQWKVSGNTARCRPISFPDDENASLAIWSSAAP